MIKTYESFAKDIDSSIEYSEYIANNLNKTLDYMDDLNSKLDNYSTSGNGNPVPKPDGSQPLTGHLKISTKTQEEIHDKDIYLGRSRIDGSSIYRNGDEIYNVQPTKNKVSEPLMVSGLTTPIWNNTDKDLGWWFKKEQSQESLSKFQKWTLGIGVGTLILGIISIIVMFIV